MDGLALREGHTGKAAGPGVIASALLAAKPGIVAGVTLAGLAGMVLASGGVPGWGVSLAGLSCIVAAAAGSAMINVVLEARTDAAMKRLAKRSRALESIRPETLAFAGVTLIAASAGLAFFFLNALTSALVVAAAASYTLLYTMYSKRRSPYGTVPGGVPGALPVLIGYSAVAGGIGADGVILFFVMLMWQPPHFLSLALKHKDDYAEAGIPVMPVTLGEHFTVVFMFIYATALLPLSLSLWVMGYCSEWFAAFAAVSWAAFVFACYAGVVKTKRPGRVFGASIVYIMAVLLAVVLDVAVFCA